MSLNENWKNIQREVYQKNPNAKIIAVSKTYPTEIIEQAISIGIFSFGENKIQEGIQKFLVLKEKGLQFELHHIGPLQTGTLRKLFGLFSYTHGVGSISSLKELSKQSEKQKHSLAFFLQVNLTEEPQKNGFSRKQLLELLPNIQNYETEFLKWEGLMTMGPTNEDLDLTRTVFSELNQIRKDYCPHKKLSMGMSADYEIALEEGADILRIGSKIFGKR